jgi:hypothetical protein
MSGETEPPKLPGLESDRTWLAETARVTAFAMPGTALVPKTWKDVFGTEPDQVMRHPSMPSVESGPRNGARWLITRQPDRIDVVVASEQPRTPPTDLLNVGMFEAIIDPLLQAAARAFDPNASIQRLAVGAILFRKAETARDAIREIQTMVPQLQRIPEGTTDFFLQINVPEMLNDPLPELLVNRLVKWQVAAMQLLTMQTGPAMSFQLTPAGVRQVVRMELDVSTSPERAVPFPNDKLGALVTRLGNVAKSLARRGGFQA